MLNRLLVVYIWPSRRAQFCLGDANAQDIDGDTGNLCLVVTIISILDMVKNKMKVLGCTRHKIVVTVDIGENKEQAMALASRCVWNAKTDNSLHVEHMTNDVYVVVGVYAIYKE